MGTVHGRWRKAALLGILLFPFVAAGEPAVVLDPANDWSALEQQAVAAAAAGRRRAALDLYVRALGAAPMSVEERLRLRKAAIGIARGLNPPPAVPEEARREFDYGRTAFGLAKGDEGFGEAAEHFGKASEAAPWWPDAYFNAALAMERVRAFDDRGPYGAAIYYYGLYLAAAPNAVDAEAVRAKINELEYKRQHAAAELLAGPWIGGVERSAKLWVEASGNKFRVRKVEGEGLNTNLASRRLWIGLNEYYLAWATSFLGAFGGVQEAAGFYGAWGLPADGLSFKPPAYVLEGEIEGSAIKAWWLVERPFGCGRTHAAANLEVVCDFPDRHELVGVFPQYDTLAFNGQFPVDYAVEVPKFRLRKPLNQMRITVAVHPEVRGYPLYRE